jgi:uncharacterized repeat protein (TIGR01451 family)/fimbrial isopeptide formation D2 family protein
MAASHPSPSTRRPLLAALIALCLIASLGLAARPALAAPAAALDDGDPLAVIDAPLAGFIGEEFEFTVGFDNTDPSAPGYGPYIDLILPAGADGDDGVTFLSASYLGAPVAPEAAFTCSGSFQHPFTGLLTACPAGAQVVILQPPFGSFTATQPRADLVVSARLSELADLNAPLMISARAGFFLGATPEDEESGDPPIIQPAPATVAYTPILWTLTKTYIGPEDETATGPSFPRQYRIDVDIADGQPISNLDITDILPPSMQFLRVEEVSAAVGAPIVSATATPGLSTPGGTLTRRLSSVTGTAGEQDATLRFSFFAPILPAASGDDRLGPNNAAASGSWTPIDPRDAQTVVTSDLAPIDHTLEEQSIAIQKGAFNVTKNRPGATAVNTPGDVIAYTLDVQISDYFAFQDLVATDVLSDGLHLDDSFTPSLVCTEHGVATSGAFAVANYAVADNWSDPNGPAVAPDPGQPSPPHLLDPAPEDGVTTLTFRISDQLADLGVDGRLLGGGIPGGGTAAGPLPNNPPLPFGGTTCQIVYRAIIQDLFTDEFPSGDRSIDQGDVLENHALIEGAVLNVSDLAPTGQREDDDTAAALQIGRGELSKTIYAINGDTSCAPGNCSGGKNTVVKPGDTVTYRLRLTFPASDIEELRLVDYLPLPIFDVTDAAAPVLSAITSFDPTVSAAPPPAGTAKFGPGDDFTAESGITPALSLDPVANSVTFYYGSYDDALNTPNTIDLLFTVTVSFDPFADKLLLTNQLRELEESTNAGQQEVDKIIQLTINEPELELRKGVVATTAANSTPDPLSLPPGVTVDPAAPCASRLGGVAPLVTSANLGLTFNSDLAGVDAGDRVTFAIVVQNAGSGPNGAFDVRIRDTLPAGLTLLPGSLCVNRGADGASMPFTTIGGGLTDPAGGIELLDPGPTQGALGSGEERLNENPIADGNNIAIVTFSATVDAGVGPNATLTNEAVLFRYANTNGGDDFTRKDLKDTAGVTTGAPSGAKIVAATSEASTAEFSEVAPAPVPFAIGEIVRYRLVVRLPEGLSRDLRLRDRLPDGLTFLDDGSARAAFVSNGAGISSVASGSIPAIPCANDTGAAATLAVLPSSAVGCALGDANISASNTNDTDSYSAGTDVYIKLGDLANGDNDGDAEFVVVELNALVDNNNTSAALRNDAGDTRTNDFQISVAGVTLATSGAAAGFIVEPGVTTTKSVSPASADAGDTVTYTVTLANTAVPAARRATAFDVVMSDPLPALLENVTIVETTTNGVVVNPVSSLSGNTLTLGAASLAPGASLTVRYSARLPASVSPGQQIVNTGTTTYTSLPGANGTAGNPTGSNNSGAPGALTGERTGSGGVNDYRSLDDATVTVFMPAPLKSIVATSEAHTSGGSVVIGEVVRYRLEARIAEGSSPNVAFRDTLPAGMRYIPGSARVALASSDPGLSSSTLTDPAVQASPYADGNLHLLTPSFALPSGAVSGGTGSGGAFQSGDDPVFALGTLTNSDSDSDQEFVVLEFDAVVENVASNQSGQSLANTFAVLFGGSASATSPAVAVTVAEPNLTTDKRLNFTTGAVVTYRVVVSNSGNATAFDAEIADTLPAGLDLNVGTIAITPAGGTADHSDAANRVRFTGLAIPPGGSVTITYEASVVTPGQQIVNTATATYTSLPGANDTGSATPGAPGDPTGERTGSGGVNDYRSSASVTLGSISDLVWYDVNGNGARDAGEPGIPGAQLTVLWYGPDGSAGTGDDSSITATTGADGGYLVSGLPTAASGANYRVTVSSATLPNGLTVPTYDLNGVGSPHVTTLGLHPATPNRDDVDFGYRGAASLGDFVWLDLNGDGAQAGEEGIGGVTVTATWHGLDGSLGTADDQQFVTTTDPSGAYAFTGLPAGNYTLAVSGLPAGLSPTYDLDGIATPGSALASLGAGEARADLDFGYEGAGSLGDRIWLDINGDGAQDAGEGGIAAVGLTLTWAGLDGSFGTGDDIAAATTTDAAGRYSFARLPAGQYRVAAAPGTLPGGVSQTYDRDDTVGAPFASPHSADLNLAANEDLDDVDFGYQGGGSLGDRVWFDTDGDGVQDAGEPGLSGVDVSLAWHGSDGAPGTADDLSFTTITDGSGAYSFTGLPAGSYSVDVDQGDAPAATALTTGNDPQAVTLAAGASFADADFGFTGVRSLGDCVWLDRDGNAAQSPGEPGIADVALTLVWAGPDGSFVTTADNIAYTTSTNDLGLYSFGGLAAGNHRVTVDPASLPGGLAQTYDLDGALDHRAEPALGAAENRDDVDFGYQGGGSLGDRVWFDTDGDGVQDAGEPGLSGVDVTLTWHGPDGAPGGDDATFSLTTGPDGLYAFTGLPAGSYSIDVDGDDAPAGSSLSTANDPHTVTLAAGAAHDTADFGFTGTGSLGDRLWLDLDGDGAQEAGEPGLVGVGLTLTWEGPDGADGTADDVVYTTVTGANGGYSFAGLPAAAFSLAVDTADLPAGLTPSHDLDGPGTPSVTAVSLTPGGSRDDADFGYQGAGSIGDRVWLDFDGDGAQDAGEPGLGNLTITLTWGGPDGDLLTAADNAAFAQDSDGSGAYDFTGLPAGPYSVDVDTADAPAGTSLTTANDPHGLSLAAGQDYNDADFGFTGAGSIGDRVWNDLDGDGVQDGGEPGIAGATLTVRWAGPDGAFGTGDDVTYTAVTAASGAYLVENLPAGSFQIAVDTATLPAGLNPTLDADGVATPSLATVALARGQDRREVDFGYTGGAATATAALGDRVWLDEDGDGAQDAGEPGIAGATVSLLSAGADRIFGTPDDFAGFTPQVTGPDGGYQFTALPAGLYRVTVEGATLPAGIAGTYELDGTLNGATDVGVASGESRTDIDFGYTSVNAGATSGSIGDRVWDDLDGDGVQDAGEPGIPGVKLGLIWFDHSGAPQAAETTTDGSGNYSFDNLAAGLYFVVVDDTTIPPGLTPSYDLNRTYNGLSILILGLGEARTDVDFGYSQVPAAPGSGSIGDRIWLDQDGDGVQDAGEPGIAAVAVTLTWHGADGLPGGDDMVFYTVTDDNGAYSFKGLPAGAFSVTVSPATLPAGLGQTYELDGTRDGATVVTLGAGASRDDVDFGYRGAGSIGDRVWEDLNGNGLQDPGEPGIGGVTVNLLRVVSIGSLSGTATQMLTATTAGDGSYSFSGLPAGTYIVEIVEPTLPGGLSQTFELDGDMDSRAVVALAPGQVRLDIDFGYTAAPAGPLAMVGDLVWLDLDSDEAQGAGEPGLAGVTVNLISAGGDGSFGTADDLIFTQLTASDGRYIFRGLLPGDYRVIVDAGSLPPGLAPTYDVDMVLDNSVTLSLSGGEERDDVDFGYQGAGSIGDRVWEDLDGDGAQGAGEPGVAGAAVTLTWAGPDGVLGSADDATLVATTDANGGYSFAGLPAGSYRVAVDSATLAPGLLPSYDRDGGLDSLTHVGLGSGQNRDDVDFGYVTPAIDLAITKGDGGAVATAGNALIYTLAYTNTGNYAATGVTISETVPEHSSFSAAGSSAGWSCADGAPAGTACTYTVGDLARAASGSLTFAVTVDAALPAGVDELSNSASIADDGAYGPDATPADNSAVELTPLQAAPDLQLEKGLADRRSSVDPGALAVYSLRYRNVGVQAATGVTISETVPQHTSFSAADSSAGWSCADGAPAGTACTFTVGELAAGAEGEVRFAIQVNGLIPTGVTAIVNSAGISDDGANGADPTPPNNSAAASSPFGFTAVTLLSFTASRVDDGVLVRWATGLELDTMGFELYRSATGQRSDATLVTPSPIAARGGPGGAEYSWRDTAAELGVRYSYWLVEREHDGGAHEYGPAQVTAATAGGAYTVHLPLIRR